MNNTLVAPSYMLPHMGTTIVRCSLTPEEDAIGDPGEEDDEIDDTLPADLWF